MGLRLAEVLLRGFWGGGVMNASRVSKKPLSTVFSLRETEALMKDMLTKKKRL